MRIGHHEIQVRGARRHCRIAQRVNFVGVSHLVSLLLDGLAVWADRNKASFILKRQIVDAADSALRRLTAVDRAGRRGLIVRIPWSRGVEAQAGIGARSLDSRGMRILLALLVAFIFLAASVVSHAAADRGDRFALVIGNAKYPDAEAPLKEPVNDARDMAEELKRNGFSVDVGENLSGEAMRRAFERLYGRIKPGSVVLLFFSGFGVQSNRQSFMIPIDAQIWTEADVRRDGFSLETVLGQINSRGAGVKIALIDASRRNPYERRFRTFSAGLAPVVAPNGTLVMYSAALSSVMSDNGSDRGLFVQQLLKEIRVPELMAEETLNRTRVGVTRASRSEQVPWISSSLAEDFSFIPVTAARPAATRAWRGGRVPWISSSLAEVFSFIPVTAARPAATAVAALPQAAAPPAAPTVPSPSPQPSAPAKAEVPPASGDKPAMK